MGFFEDRDDVGPPPEQFRFGREGGFRSPFPLKWVGLAAGLIIFFIAANILKSLYVDILWFDSVSGADGDSYAGVFRRQIIAQVSLFFIGTFVTGVVLGLNIWLARRFAPRGPEESFIEDVDPVAIRRLVIVALIAGTLFLAVVFGAVAAGAWETILSWRNAVPFGVEDPAFNRDISFYLFDLPAYHFIRGWVLALLIVSGLAAGSVYLLSFSLQGFELRVPRGMRIHLSILGGLALATIALGTLLSVFDLASEPSGIVTGATFADINARVPVRYALVVIGLFAGLATIINGIVSNGWRVPAFAVGLWIIVSIFGGFAYPAFVQSFNVDPNELEKEEQFIARNIEFTRLAWGLDKVEVDDRFEAAEAVTQEEIDANPATIRNIRLLDARPTKNTLNQIQSIRPLYTFTDVDVDRYVIDGSLRQVMLAPRELNLAQAAAQTGSGWTQERLQFTHGYGAVVLPVNTVTAEGLPTFFTQDIPPAPADSPVPLTEDGARIYFGELTNHYVLVKTGVEEFDYPSGDATVDTTYEPDRGIAIGNFLRRFVLAWELGDRNLLISGQLDSDSRLLMDRSLNQRIRRIAPFLSLDADPYIVIELGQIFWIQDAYTTSGNFPYSQRLGGINYIRNSVKIVVDAITGDTTFYLVDPNDPVAATWAKIFPDLFTPDSEMPDYIRVHLRYPEDLFFLQARQYLAYHITDPGVFFKQEDLWNIPTEKFRAQEQPVEPYYVVMTLPGEETEEFTLILPFTPRNRQNAIAWLAGRSDGEHLGKLRAYRFPTDDIVFGPAQIEARIDQDTGISQQLTLWDQSGSEVIRGNLLMIPIGNSFLYIEPIYLQASTSRLPELQRVVVANGDRIAMEPTFQQALDVVFGRRASTLPGAGGILEPPSTTTTPDGGDGGDGDGGGTVPAGDLGTLVDAATDAADAAQGELDRLRAILREIGALQDQ